MEIVIFSAGSVLRDQIRRTVEAALTYRQGALLSLYPDMPATGAELLQLARPDKSWLVIAQTGGDPAWLELCEAFQRRADRAWFLLLGRGAAECLSAVQRHLHLADYLLEQDPRLDDALRESLNRFTGGGSAARPTGRWSGGCGRLCKFSLTWGPYGATIFV